MCVIISTEMWLVEQKGGFAVPTQEERVSAFEQTVTALSRDIKDINHNETMLLGMALKQGEDIREIRSNLASMSTKQGEDIREIRSNLASMSTKQAEDIREIRSNLASISPRHDDD